MVEAHYISRARCLLGERHALIMVPLLRRHPAGLEATETNNTFRTTDELNSRLI